MGGKGGQPPHKIPEDYFAVDIYLFARFILPHIRENNPQLISLVTCFVAATTSKFAATTFKSIERCLILTTPTHHESRPRTKVFTGDWMLNQERLHCARNWGKATIIYLPVSNFHITATLPCLIFCFNCFQSAEGWEIHLRSHVNSRETSFSCKLYQARHSDELDLDKLINPSHFVLASEI